MDASSTRKSTSSARSIAARASGVTCTPRVIPVPTIVSLPRREPPISAAYAAALRWIDGSARAVQRAYALLVPRRLRRADARADAGLARDRARRQRARAGADRLREDARRLPLRDRSADRDAGGRAATALRLAVESAELRR